jgi:hypothetical protein
MKPGILKTRDIHLPLALRASNAFDKRYEIEIEENYLNNTFYLLSKTSRLFGFPISG